jgi:hypothetical protein
MEYIVFQESRASDFYIVPGSSVAMLFKSKKDKIHITDIQNGTSLTISPVDGGRIKSFESLTQALAYVEEKRESDISPTPPI